MWRDNRSETREPKGTNRRRRRQKKESEKDCVGYRDVFNTLYVLVWKCTVYNEHKSQCCSSVFPCPLEGDLIRYTVLSGGTVFAGIPFFFCNRHFMSII